MQIPWLLHDALHRRDGDATKALLPKHMSLRYGALRWCYCGVQGSPWWFTTSVCTANAFARACADADTRLVLLAKTPFAFCLNASFMQVKSTRMCLRACWL